MITISTSKTSRPHKSFWSAFLMLFVVLGLFSGVFSKSALASNNYFNNVVFTKEAVTNNLILTFHVITTFTNSRNGGGGWAYPNAYLQGVSQIYALFFWPVGGGDTPFTFTAGNTYSNYIYNDSSLGTPITQPGIYGVMSSTALLGNSCGTYHEPFYTCPANCNCQFEPFNIDFADTEDYPFYYVETPTVTITYPQDNDEIVDIFDITGSFTQPAENPSSFLQADIMPTGTYISPLQSFWTAINQATSGNFSITIGNVPAGYYDFRIYFRSGAFDYYQGALISNIHIVNDLPPFIPPWAEQPPSTAPVVFEPVATSTFSSSTGLYTQLTNTFAPVIVSIVSNLQQFSSNFTQSNASSTGTQIGQSILLVRSYLSNINSFFSNFPVSQFLLLYLIALVVVIVLRLTKGLINLFKI